MRLLIIHQRGLPLSLPGYEEDVKINTFPTGDGIAVFEAGRGQIKWDWPDYVVTVGEVDVGRHDVDVHLDAVGDVGAQLRQIIDSILLEFVDDEEEGV